MNWLITGEGEMIDKPSVVDVSRHEVSDPDMDRIFRALTRLLIEIGELREDVTDIKVGSARQSSE